MTAQKALRAYQRNIAQEGPAKSTEYVEKLQTENKAMQERLSKQEAEIKEIVATLKQFAEEKKSLEVQLTNQKLHQNKTQNDVE